MTHLLAFIAGGLVASFLAWLACRASCSGCFYRRECGVLAAENHELCKRERSNEELAA